MSNNLLTDELSAPLNGAITATIEIDTGTGNLIVDDLIEGTQVLATGALQYFQKQGRPTELVSSENGQASVKLKATEIPPDERAPILKAYCAVATSGRYRFPVPYTPRLRVRGDCRALSRLSHRPARLADGVTVTVS